MFDMSALVVRLLGFLGDSSVNFSSTTFLKLEKNLSYYICYASLIMYKKNYTVENYNLEV